MPATPQPVDESQARGAEESSKKPPAQARPASAKVRSRARAPVRSRSTRARCPARGRARGERGTGEACRRAGGERVVEPGEQPVPRRGGDRVPGPAGHRPPPSCLPGRHQPPRLCAQMRGTAATLICSLKMGIGCRLWAPSTAKSLGSQPQSRFYRRSTNCLRPASICVSSPARSLAATMESGCRGHRSPRLPRIPA
jgi:hypothetical protein